MSRRRTWAHLRSLRSAPPNLASNDDARRRLFSAALEQSTQLFAAAEATPPHARPILLFYGLSQAGRAIAAAHAGELAKGGHGVSATRLHGPFTEVVVRDKGDGAFQTIAAMVGSPTLPEAMPLGRLYASLPTTVDVVLEQPVDALPALTLEPEVYDSGAAFTITSIATGWVDGVPSSLLDPEDELSRERVAAFLSSYPTLEGWTFPAQPPVPMQTRRGPSGVGVRLAWLVTQGGGGEHARQERVRAAGVFVPGSQQLWVPPELADGQGPLAPIVAWWATLFALSMLARYEPSSWVDTLQPDHSLAAVPVESLLEAALDQLPMLILATLQDPHHWRPAQRPKDPRDR
jgi:hypothetical protein